MKKNIFFLLLSLPLLFSCSDEIPFDERYEELPSVELKRNILLEDFTGQFCSNCPEAHQVINDLKAVFGGNVIAVAIHAGHFGIAENDPKYSNFVGLMQPEGSIYATHWKIDDYPRGVINRTSEPLLSAEWADYSLKELVKEPQAAITLAAEIVNDSIFIHTELQSENALSGKLQLWITESNITAVQQNGGTLDIQYQHHHVYRAAANGIWGEDVTLVAGSPTTCEHSIALRDNWNVENLSVVAFIYTEADGVLEVTEHHIGE